MGSDDTAKHVLDTKISYVRSFNNKRVERTYVYTAGIWFLAAQKKTNDVDLSRSSSFVQFSQQTQTIEYTLDLT